MLTIKLSCRRTASYVNLGRINRKLLVCYVEHDLRTDSISRQNELGSCRPVVCCLLTDSIKNARPECHNSKRSACLLQRFVVPTVAVSYLAMEIYPSGLSSWRHAFVLSNRNYRACLNPNTVVYRAGLCTVSSARTNIQKKVKALRFYSSSSHGVQATPPQQ